MPLTIRILVSDERHNLNAMGRVLAWTVLLTLCTPLAWAQPSSAPQLNAEDAVKGCRPLADPGGVRLNTTLPLDLLDYLDRVSSSPFVHAYLLDHVATHGAKDHWLVQCATMFIEKELWEVSALRENHLQTRTILHELRKVAENRRLDKEVLGDDGKVALTTLISRAIGELSPDNAEAYKGYFVDFYRRCPGATSPLCTTLDEVIGALDTLHAKANELSEASTALTALRDEADATRALLRESEAAASRDSIQAATLQALVVTQAQRGQADSTAVQPSDTVAALEQSASSKNRLDSLRARLGPDGIESELENQANEVNTKRQAATEVLDRIRAKLQVLRGIAATASLVLPAGDLTPSGNGTEISPLDVQPPTAALAAGPGAAPSADILVGLVDFVVGRAKQEIVLAYLGTVYQWMRQEELVKTTFPQTYRLLGSLSNQFAEKNLSIGAAGRVPLNVWRATLAADFRSLPRTLINDGAVLLCAGRAVGSAECRTQLHQLRVVGEVGYRLMEGEPTLDVVNELAVIASGSGVDPSEEWTRLVQALRVIATVAQTYRVQGFVPTGGAERYAYVLSAENYAQSSPQLRKAFVRTLILGAVPEGGSVPPASTLTSSKRV